MADDAGAPGTAPSPLVLLTLLADEMQETISLLRVVDAATANRSRWRRITGGNEHVAHQDSVPTVVTPARLDAIPKAALRNDRSGGAADGTGGEGRGLPGGDGNGTGGGDFFMSVPVQNDFSPAPVSTATRISESVLTRSQILVRSAVASGSSEFIASGRLSVTKAT